MPWPNLRVEQNVDKDIPIGIDYPLFTRYTGQEQQTTPLLDVILDERPYPIKALVKLF